MRSSADSDSRLSRRFFLALPLALAGCRKEAPPKPLRSFDLMTQPEAWSLIADIPNTGELEAKSDMIRLHSGKPITAARYSRWQEQAMPVVDYEIRYEAMRESGTDFFNAVTFPVRKLSDCCTFVLGAWGGGLAGISNIDNQDANENTTRSEHRFEQGKWYAVRIEVRADYLRVWLNEARIVNAYIEGHKISQRPGELEACAPFGLGTYWTTGCIRGLVVRELAPGQ
jgi:hypothetical protein